jgi:hypothetical protein
MATCRSISTTTPTTKRATFAFINSYLESVGADPVNLDQFANLPSSKASGAADIGRLTNLMNLNVDTSFWTRYRSDNHNPDLDPNFVFGQAENIVNSNRNSQNR